MFEPLSAEQQRVLGSLAEKAATVPDTYPMTLNGLRVACNQRNSRDPVTDYEESTIQATLDELKARGLVRFVYASHGARSTKYRHVLDEQLGLEPDELAVVTVLLLRGPQTVNELRTRTERAHTFEGNEQVEDTLRALAERAEPVVVQLDRQVGQKELRWAHLLGDAVPPARTEGTAVEPRPARTVDGPAALLEERLARLESRVTVLEELLTGVGGRSADSARDHEDPAETDPTEEEPAEYREYDES